ncbi:zinc finger protein OZF isoform X2 [Bicyclus anynana]|uniref:Zinc finger protein OZF isoform X2 n=1 Tax=Bicyclus anynana TaxID=110368 RepID=A0ABM3M1A1_BICAN|nr:zinc finger protein OZF isoform X2 [Bicyclus anynana]
MENTCRLCLNETSESLEEIWEGCEVLEKLSSCLSHHISIRDDFPKKICLHCSQMVQDIYSFHQQIRQNEIMLQHKSNKYKCHIKKEEIKSDTNSSDHDNEFNTDEVNRTYELIIEETKSKKENTVTVINDEAKQINKEELNVLNISKESDNLNNQKNDIYETGDNIPLSVLKENKHKSTNNIENSNKFTCLTCFKVFDSRLELLKHYQNIELVRFNKNNEALNDETKPIQYKMVEDKDGSVTYKCERCYKKYKHKKYIQRHIKSHIDKRPYLCKLCGKTYQTASLIVAHGKMHAGDLFSCTYGCGYQSVHKHVVTDHEKRHRNEYKYKCETCGKGFQVLTWYQQHQNIHNDVRPFACDRCDKSFHMHKYLMVHKSNVHPQSSGRKPWLCQLCGLPCDSKNCLNQHLKQIHGIATTKANLCDVCGKVVRDSRQLQLHKRAVHLKIKPFSCSLCEKSFQKKYTLKVHQQTHAGKRHACAVCHRTFARRDTLARHLRNCHTDCKNKCRKCDKIFPSKLKLAHHKNCTSVVIEDSQSR